MHVLDWICERDGHLFLFESGPISFMAGPFQSDQAPPVWRFPSSSLLFPNGATIRFLNDELPDEKLTVGFNEHALWTDGPMGKLMITDMGGAEPSKLSPF